MVLTGLLDGGRHRDTIRYPKATVTPTVEHMLIGLDRVQRSPDHHVDALQDQATDLCVLADKLAARLLGIRACHQMERLLNQQTVACFVVPCFATDANHAWKPTPHTWFQLCQQVAGYNFATVSDLTPSVLHRLDRFLRTRFPSRAPPTHRPPWCARVRPLCKILRQEDLESAARMASALGLMRLSVRLGSALTRGQPASSPHTFPRLGLFLQPDVEPEQEFDEEIDKTDPDYLPTHAYHVSDVQNGVADMTASQIISGDAWAFLVIDCPV